MPEPIRWGIIGTGFIADMVCSDLALARGNVIEAVAARDLGRAADFAARHGATSSYGSYQELVDDVDVDVVYITTTHPHHRDQALLAIAAGKPVLIEKPLCLNAADARTVFEAAREAGVFAMEAMWMRTNPLIRKAVDLVAEGAIGALRGIRDEFGLGLPYDATHRLYDLSNGGGGLLDLGVYPATFAYLFLGRPDEIKTTGTLSASGADDTVAMEWFYSGVSKAQLSSSVSIPVPNQAAILGTEGWIVVEGGARRPSGLVVHSRGTEYRIEDPIADQGYGYVPQIEEVERCLRTGLLESPLIPQADTVAILEVLDEARAALGVKYPGE